MKNFFKKAIVCAGIMASALALSSMVVFAEDTIVTWNMTDPTQYNNGTSDLNSDDTQLYKGTTYTIKSNNEDYNIIYYTAGGKTTDKADTIDKTNGLKHSGTGTNAQRVSTLTVPAGASVRVNVKSQSNEGYLEYKIGDSEDTQNDTKITKDSYVDIDVYTNNTTEATTLKFWFTQKDYVKSITMTIPDANAEATSNKYFWSTDNIVIPTGLNVQKTDFSFGKAITTESENTLKYNGDKYTVETNPFTVTASSTEEVSDLGNGFKSYNATVTLDASKFEEIKHTTAKITVDSKLGLTNPVIFVDESKNEIEGTLENNIITATLNQNTTYTIDVLRNQGYWNSQYVFADNENVITVTNEDTINGSLSATKITTWDLSQVGKTLPELTFENGKVKYQNGSGQTIDTKYKGLTLTYSGGKMAFSGNKSQCKTDITIEVPSSDLTEGKILKAYDNEGKEVSSGDGYTVTITGNTLSNIKTGSDQKSIYLSKIEIVDKPVEITKATAATNVAVVSYNGKYYAVAVVSKADAETKDTLKLAYTNGSKTSSTVYKNITIDKDYDATAFLDSATADDYLYAVEISNASGNGIVDKIQTITVSLE